MDKSVLELILAVVLPPVAVYLRKGFSYHLVINIILTIFGYIFGIIHALGVILSDRKISYPVGI